MDKETKEKLQKALVKALEEEKRLQEDEKKRKEKEPDNPQRELKRPLYDVENYERKN